MAQLNQLIDPQLAALLQAAAAADSSTPTFFSVGPNGESQANFQGKIQAEGLEMKEYQGVLTKLLSTIRWNNSKEEEREGVVAYEEKSLELGAGPYHKLEFYAVGKGSFAGLQLQGSDAGSEGEVIAIADSARKTILDSFGQSGYVQVAGANRTMMVTAGIVGSAGAGTGSNFVSARTGVGSYSIFFTTPMPTGAYTVTGNDAQGTSRLFTWASVGKTGFNVAMTNPGSFVKEDIAFSFIAMSSP